MLTMNDKCGRIWLLATIWLLTTYVLALTHAHAVSVVSENIPFALQPAVYYSWNAQLVLDSMAAHHVKTYLLVPACCRMSPHQAEFTVLYLISVTPVSCDE